MVNIVLRFGFAVFFHYIIYTDFGETLKTDKMEKKIEMPGFFLKADWGKLFEKFNHDDVGIIIKNLYRHHYGIDLLEMNFATEVFFEGTIIDAYEHNSKKYIERVEKNRLNGSKGGAPKGNSNAKKTTQNNPEQHKENNRDIDNINDKRNNKENNNVNEINNDTSTESNNINEIVSNKDLTSNKNSYVEENNLIDVSINNKNYDSGANNNIDEFIISNNKQIRTSSSDLPPGAMLVGDYLRSKNK